MAESIGGYLVHPVASKFPLLSEEEATDLRESIKQYGQREPIKVTKDKVLIDGRNRLLAISTNKLGDTRLLQTPNERANVRSQDPC